MKRLRLFYVIFVLILVNLAPILSQTKGEFEQETSFNNKKYKAFVYVPEDYSPLKSYPLIIAIHGNEMGASNMRTFMKSIAVQLKAILVCPDEQGLWNTSASLGGLDFALKNYSINNRAIVASGYSSGGAVAIMLANNNPTYFKMVITMSPYVAGIPSNIWNEMKKVKAGYFIGTADDIAGDVSKFFTQIGNEGLEIKSKIIQGMDHEGFIESQMKNYYNSNEFYSEWINIYNSFKEKDPQIYVANNEIDFGEKIVNTSDTIFITIENRGKGSLHISSIDFADFANGFKLDKEYTAISVEPNSELQIKAIFNPTLAQNFSSVLEIKSDDLANPSILINLTGSAREPITKISLSAAKLDYGKCNNKSSKKVKITNNGETDIDKLSISFLENEETAFSTSDIPNGFILSKGASTEININFNPQKNQEYTAKLKINASDNVSSIIELSGKGDFPVSNVNDDENSLIKIESQNTVNSIYIRSINEATIQVIKIYDLLGNELISKQINDESSISIDSSELNTGMYIIRIRTSKGFKSLIFSK